MANAMDGAGFWALRRLFGDRPSFGRVFEQYQRFAGFGIGDLVPVMESAVRLPTSALGQQILSRPLTRVSAVRAGAAACERIIEKVHFICFWPGKKTFVVYGGWLRPKRWIRWRSKSCTLSHNEFATATRGDHEL